MLAVDELPDDPKLLKRLLAERDATIEQIKREAADQLEAERQRHKAELDAVLRRLYGPRSERFDPTQLLLFGVHVDTMPLNVRKRAVNPTFNPSCD
jgi:hypothetical protein